MDVKGMTFKSYNAWLEIRNGERKNKHCKLKELYLPFKTNTKFFKHIISYHVKKTHTQLILEDFNSLSKKY